MRGYKLQQWEERAKIATNPTSVLFFVRLFLAFFGAGTFVLQFSKLGFFCLCSLSAVQLDKAETGDKDQKGKLE